MLMRIKILAELSRDIWYHPMIEYPLEILDAVIVYPRLGARFSKIYDIQSSAMSPCGISHGRR